MVRKNSSLSLMAPGNVGHDTIFPTTSTTTTPTTTTSSRAIRITQKSTPPTVQYRQFKTERFNSLDNGDAPSWMDRNKEFQGNSDSNDFYHEHDMGRTAEQSNTMNNNSDRATDKQRRRRNKKRREEFNENQSFRDNFRGCRVFVQNIPSWATWRELKDHFKVAGEVVFASVSIDSNTGDSKGCGVVQFDTTNEARNAIKIMRDHPMEEGTALFVREDHQERGDPSERKLSTRSATPSAPFNTWRCADEGNASGFSEDERTMIENLIKARDQARKRKNYDTSDNIRDDLKLKFGIHLDDRLKQWWNNSSDNKVPESIASIKGEGRWGKQKTWRQIPTTEENDACVDPNLVEGLLTQRDIARKEKDFATADRLLHEAKNAPDGDLVLLINDESRSWRIWTPDRPPKPVSHGSNLSAAEQCIAIVQEHEPGKVKDIKVMLDKFPGREYNILRKLKQNYL